MEPSPTYHPPEREECEISVEHGSPLWAEPAVGYCSRRPRPSPMRGSRFVGARAVGPWVGEEKPLGKTPLRGSPSPESTYLLPTFTTTSVFWPNTVVRGIGRQAIVVFQPTMLVGCNDQKLLLRQRSLANQRLKQHVDQQNWGKGRDKKNFPTCQVLIRSQTQALTLTP